MSLVRLEPQSEPARCPPQPVLCVAGCAGLAAALIFAAFPEIDLGVSRLFYLDSKTFLFAKGTTGGMARELLRFVFAVACTAAVAGFVMIAFFSRRLLGLGFAAWAYLALCVAIGPGLVSNVIFKDHWGRARPVQVVEFGGTKQFTPALTRSRQCEKNCSFVSGEASNFFMIGFALALLAVPARRRQMFWAAIAAGSFAGLLRIGGGGHFLSDVVFAGVFMVFVARGLEWLLFERLAEHFAEDGPLHRRTHRAGRVAGYRALKGARAVRDWLRARRKAMAR